MPRALIDRLEHYFLTYKRPPGAEQGAGRHRRRLRPGRGPRGDRAQPRGLPGAVPRAQAGWRRCLDSRGRGRILRIELAPSTVCTDSMPDISIPYADRAGLGLTNPDGFPFRGQDLLRVRRFPRRSRPPAPAARRRAGRDHAEGAVDPPRPARAAGRGGGEVGPDREGLAGRLRHRGQPDAEHLRPAQVPGRAGERQPLHRHRARPGVLLRRRGAADRARRHRRVPGRGAAVRRLRRRRPSAQPVPEPSSQPIAEPVPGRHPSPSCRVPARRSPARRWVALLAAGGRGRSSCWASSTSTSQPRAATVAASGGGRAVRPAIAVLDFRSLSPERRNALAADRLPRDAHHRAGGRRQDAGDPRRDRWPRRSGPSPSGRTASLEPRRPRAAARLAGRRPGRRGHLPPHRGQDPPRPAGGPRARGARPWSRWPRWAPSRGCSTWCRGPARSCGRRWASPRCRREQARQARALRPASPETRPASTPRGCMRLRAFDPPGRPELAAAGREGRSRLGGDPLGPVAGLGGPGLRRAGRRRRPAGRWTSSGSLPREERLAIEARLYQVSKQWERASETYRSLWTFFPDEIEYGLQLADSLMLGAGAPRRRRRSPPCAGCRRPRARTRASTLPRRATPGGSRISPTQLRAAETAVAKGRSSGQTLVVARALIYPGDALVRMGRPRRPSACSASPGAGQKGRLPVGDRHGRWPTSSRSQEPGRSRRRGEGGHRGRSPSPSSSAAASASRRSFRPGRAAPRPGRAERGPAVCSSSPATGTWRSATACRRPRC